MSTKCSASGADWECNRKAGRYGLCVAHRQQAARGNQLKPLRRRTLAKAYRHDPDALINEVPEGHKRCLYCRIIFPLANYRPHEKSPDGLASKCNVCESDYHMDGNYGPGASLWWRWKMLDQGYKCVYCDTDDPRNLRGWHLDHDHNTGEWRDIICARCNWLLGHYENGYDAVKAATAMAKRYPVI